MEQRCSASEGGHLAAVCSEPGCKGTPLRCSAKNEAFCAIFDTLFGTNSAPILLINPEDDGAVVDANKKALEFYGYSREAFRQLHVWDINTLGRAVLPVMREISSWAGGHYPQRFRHRLADGTIRDVQVYAGPVQLADCKLLLCIVQDITAVIEAEQFNRLLLDSVNVGVCGIDDTGAFTFVNPEAVRAFGVLHESEVIKLGIHRFLGDAGEQAGGEIHPILRMASTGPTAQGIECFMRKADGTLFPVRLVVSPIRVGDRIQGSVLSFTDLTKQREQEEQVADLINSVPGIVFQAVMAANGRFSPTYFNAAATGFLGISSEIDLTSPEVLSSFLPRFGWIGLLRSLKRSARWQQPWEREFQINGREGGKWLLGRAKTRLQSNGDVAFTGVLLDITDRKRLEARLEAAALTDSLTGLKNRRHFEQALKTSAERHLAQARPYSLMVVDIDHFKQLNDRYGHDVGDDTLRHVAGILQLRSREMDCAARWGGEEFAVLLPDTGLEFASSLANDIRSHVAEAGFPADGLSVSIGVGEVASGEDPGAFFRRVDAALYRAKANGRNRVELA
ncbi:sensor domain-containing diguanylate cyclase [Pleomorphomonas oryzae]|uniref:sensor domain-containing diguanylate cyclase n=1 Tax=Pleomorphomonas oryzae TaxID=261934 RepID=UPI000410BE5D|nr:sensor domain-containing diguanylate cyclase [Pleomorphomonas oryzae]